MEDASSAGPLGSSGAADIWTYVHRLQSEILPGYAMKILFTLHDEHNPDAGGMGVTIGLADVYRRLGHEVAYLSFADMPARLPFRSKALLFPEFVAARLRGSTVDVIDAAVGDGWLLGLMRSPRSGPLLVARSHGLVHMADRARREEARRGGLELSWKYPLYWGGFRLWETSTALKRADLSLFLNDEERDFSIDSFGLAPESARVVDNGIPDRLLGLPIGDIAPPSERFRVAHIGSYLPLKGVRYAVAALTAVLRRHAQAEASFFGSGGSPERVLADFPPELRSRVNVIPHFGRGELPELLRGHAAVLSATLKEGFPLGTLEAMACGLAAVTAATPGPLQYVRDGVNGLVVPRAESAGLEDALERLIAEPELLQRLRGAASETAQRYSWDRVARDTLELYAEARERRSLRS